MGVPFNWLDPKLKVASKNPVRVIGIDLGTTITMVTEVTWDPSSDEPPVARVVEVPQELEGHGTQTSEFIPSVVALVADGDDDHIFVGEGAKRLKAQHHRFRRNKSIWWEAKNEIGTRRTWPQSPEGFKTPKDISAKILAFINNHVENLDDRPIDRVVVTVPASFQMTQRQDTLEAAEEAGIDLRPGDLLDEPVAAFMDFMAQDRENELLADRENTRIMVVDFGGGTCDVALLSVRRNSDGGLEMSRRGVSRFHRVGGGDLDVAIANDVLLPKLLEENGIAAFEVGYITKRDILLPALASMAETLKINLSNKVRAARGLGNFDPANLMMEVKQPGQLVIENTGIEDHPTVALSEPSLNLGEMMRAVGEFLNPNQVEAVSSEYYGITSIFTPIYDVLGRAKWTNQHVDEILLVGGSSLFHFVSAAVSEAFPDSNVRSYRNPDDAQRCVGRGAAWQALLLSVYGKSPMSPTLGEGLSIRTTGGEKELIPENSALPFPGKSKTQKFADLKVPSDIDEEPLSIALSFKSGDVSLNSSLIEIKPPVKKGAKIELEYSVDENQKIVMSVSVDKTNTNQQFEIVLDNPLSLAANSNADRDRILEIEELLVGPPEEHIDEILELVRLNRKLRGYDRARQLLTLLSNKAPDFLKGEILHDLGELCGDMLDVDKSIEYYKASVARNYEPAWFNYPFKLNKLGRNDEALAAAEELVARRGEPQDSFLKANILLDMGREAEGIETGNAAIIRILPFSSASDWMLAWANRNVHLSKNSDWIDEFTEERKKRRERNKDANIEFKPGVVLPD